MRNLFLTAMFLTFGLVFAQEIQGRPDIRPLLNHDIVRIAGAFGEKRSAEGATYFHTGIDYASYLDTNIFATGEGEVIFARYISGYGNCVIIKHDWIDHKGRNQSAFSLYGHLIEFRVIKGQKVSKRQSVGLVGDTGRAQGCHLHYELRNAQNRPIYNGTYQIMNNQGI